MFCLDVDGVMTDGGFYYTAKGKLLKKFGAEDGDALRVLGRFIEIRFVTADHRGLDISRARIERDLGFPLELVSSESRLSWLTERYSLEAVAFMGDSFTDRKVLRAVKLGISPANASLAVQKFCNHTTSAAGGQGAVAEACFFLADLVGFRPVEFADPPS